MSLEAVEERPDSNVRFCLGSLGSSTWSQREHSDGAISLCFCFGAHWSLSVGASDNGHLLVVSEVARDPQAFLKIVIVSCRGKIFGAELHLSGSFSP